MLYCIEIDITFRNDNIDIYAIVDKTRYKSTQK